MELLNPFFRNWPTEYHSMICLLYHQEYAISLHIDITRLCFLIEHVLLYLVNLRNCIWWRNSSLKSKFNSKQWKNEVFTSINQNYDNATYLHSVIFSSHQKCVSLGIIYEKSFKKEENSSKKRMSSTSIFVLSVPKCQNNHIREKHA